MKKFIEQFNPAWGAAIMGTGVLSILFTGMGGGFATAGFTLFLLNTAVLIYALVGWVLMWFVSPGKIKRIVNNANMLVFVPTVPVGVVVWANNSMALRAQYFPWLSPLFPALLWAVSSVIILVLAVHFVDRVFASANIEITHSTFGWLIPPVALLIIPLGAPLFIHVFPTAAVEPILIFSYGMWGAGFLAYVFINAAVTHRYFFHEMPMNQMTPSVWVGIGPVGAGVAGLLSLSRAVHSVPALKSLADFGFGFSLLLWGFGIFWYMVALVLTLRKAFFENIPYTMGWWAFTFPLGAYTLATRLLYAQTGVPVLGVLYWILFVNLSVFWLITVYRTTKFVLTADQQYNTP